MNTLHLKFGWESGAIKIRYLTRHEVQKKVDNNRLDLKITWLVRSEIKIIQENKGSRIGAFKSKFMITIISVRKYSDFFLSLGFGIKLIVFQLKLSGVCINILYLTRNCHNIIFRDKAIFLDMRISFRECSFYIHHISDSI